MASMAMLNNQRVFRMAHMGLFEHVVDASIPFQYMTFGLKPPGLLSSGSIVIFPIEIAHVGDMP